MTSPYESLQRLVEDLADNHDVALARIWLIQAGDICESCRLRSQCRDRERCLHLVTSAGKSIDPTVTEQWNRIDGTFRRFPLHSAKIGRIGMTGESLLVHHVAGHSELARQDWLTREGIQSFVGHPLTRNGTVLGVLGVFSRADLADREVRFLRQIADCAAQIVANAESLTELDHHIVRLESENDYLRKDLEAASLFGPLVSCGPASRKLVEQIRLAADHAKPVLVTGECGTGKELAARLIHERGSTRSGPFVKIEADSLTDEVLDSKPVAGDPDTAGQRLVRRLSRLELAETGTLFIENIERTPLDLQESLVAALNSTAFGQQDPTVSPPCFGARIIASSAVDLRTEVESGRLNHQLYCAISVVSIEVPPLRERTEDIPLLVTELLGSICRRLHRPNLEIDRDDLTRLCSQNWPGNVRELQNLLQTAVLQARQGRLCLQGILPEISSAASQEESDATHGFLTDREWQKKERANLIACLKHCHWKVYGAGGAAELLGTKPTTLLYRMKVLEIRKPSR